MNHTSPTSGPGPSDSLRELSDRIQQTMSAAAKRLDLPKVDLKLPGNSAEFDAITPGEQFAKLEELLRRTLEKTELQADSEKALDRLNPKQRDYNLLVVEVLTNLFEGYRALRYQTEILTRTLAEVCEKMPQWQNAVFSSLTENAARIEQAQRNLSSQARRSCE